MRILVTGASGFIGCNLVPLLRGSGHDVMACCHSFVADGYDSVQFDITSASQTRMVARNYCPHAIVHLAGHSTVAGCDGEPSKMTAINVQGAHNLLAYAPKDCRFVLASSCSVYGRSRIIDDDFDEYSRTNPESPYAATKLAAEALVKAYTNLGNVRGISARLVAQVGPHSTHGLFHDVVRKLRSDSEFLELLGDCPGSMKPFMHVKDTCLALRALAEGDCSDCGILNIAPGGSLSVADFAEICMQEFDIRKPVKWLGWDANFAGDSPYLFISNQRFMDRVCGRYSMSSTEAVRQAIRDVKGVSE